MAGRLQDKVALITGTARGIGRAAALMFAKEGAKVIGCTANNVEGSKETVRMVKDAGGEMISLEPVNLSDEKQVAKLMNLINDKYGRLDVLYNNASTPRFAPTAEMPYEDWKFTISNELDLVFVVIKAAIPLMTKYGGGSIINTSSQLAIQAKPGMGNVGHASAKAGILGLTIQTALDLAPHGIRVNAILPGLIRTPATEPFVGDPEHNKLSLQKILLGRFGEPEEIASVALFLASDESSYMTGSWLLVDGGQTIW